MSLIFALGEDVGARVASSEGAEMPSFDDNSSIWASTLSVRDVGRDIVRLRVNWKARRDCFCLAESV